MKLNIVKKITLISVATFLLTGCNIYRQMVIPTPYYPSDNTQTTANVDNTDTGEDVVHDGVVYHVLEDGTEVASNAKYVDLAGNPVEAE